MRRKGRTIMANNNELRVNGSGYSDPTAYQAITNIEAEQSRFDRFLKTIFMICELAGYHIEERIVVKDLKTGRIWR